MRRQNWINFLFLASFACLGLFLSPLVGGARGTARAVDGATQAEAPAPKIGVVAALKIADDLMDTDRFKPARQEYEDQLNKELLRPIAEKLEEFQKQIKELDEKDPQSNLLKQEFMRARGELTAKQREVATRLEQKISEQLKECFGLIRASAALVAEKRGFNYVLSSLRPDDKFEIGPVQAAIRDMMSRPAIVFPDGVDITEDVREDLKL